MAQLDPITWFRSAHPEQGSLRVQVSAAQGIFPIPGAGGHNRAYYVRGRCGYGGEHHAGAVPVCA